MELWIARDGSIIPEDMVHFIEQHPKTKINYTKLHMQLPDMVSPSRY